MLLRNCFLYVGVFAAVVTAGSLPQFGNIEATQHYETKQVRSGGLDYEILLPASSHQAFAAIETTSKTVDTTELTYYQQKASLLEALTYANSLMLLETDMSTGGVDREYVLKSIDKVYEQLSDSNKNILTDGSFARPQLTDTSLIGITSVEGFFGIGSSSPTELLTVEGAVYIGETVPDQITNRLYNTEGELFWNGSVLSGTLRSPWTTSAGDIFRSSGVVGIGTTTPTSALTVDGGGLFTDSLIAPILDTGGQVCNVEAYGAVGDNSTINDAAIARAIAECPAGEAIYFPMGEFRIATPIVLDQPVTFRGAYSPRWSYSSTPRSSIRADFGSFAGVALIHVRDKSISGQANDNNGGRLENISLDGGSAGTDVNGIYFEGLVRDWKLTDVDISQVTGNGFEAAVGTGSGNPRGFTIRGLSIYSADGHGFRATALNDSYIDDLLSVGNALRGIYLSSMGETKVANSRAVFNGLTGLYIDGATANGGISFTDFSTDRNDRHGVRISASGTSTIIFNGLLTRRDGPNTSGGSETPYAGVAIIGSPTEKVAPVFISGLGQTVGVDDSGVPPLSPSVGVRVTNAEYVKIDGQLWGVDEAWRDDGGNDYFIIEDDAILKTGTADDKELFTNDRKWKSVAGDELIFGKRVHIGSSTGSRLLNITAPDQVGARLQDTTNDVIFDVRVEDFQGFLGTFSNHQLRLQTNNISRLTIDIDGDVGIGETSPDSELDVVGTIQASNLLGGVTTLSTDANGNIIRSASDRRLKENITDIDNALDLVLGLRGVTYNWLDTDRFGTQAEMGFIAQEVEDVVPEVVQQGGEYWSLNTANLVAVVVEAIQEMWLTISGLREDMDAQEERIQVLEALLDVQEARDNSPAQSDSSTVDQSDTPVEEITSDIATTTEDIVATTTPVAAEVPEVLIDVTDPLITDVVEITEIVEVITSIDEAVEPVETASSTDDSAPMNPPSQADLQPAS